MLNEMKEMSTFSASHTSEEYTKNKLITFIYKSYKITLFYWDSSQNKL